jgi:3-oxoadipate enol-lactonase
MRHADVAGLRLHYLRRGEGEPLLLIQGMSGTHLSWGEPFEAALAGAGLELITYDHRGVGHSARVDEGFSIVELADDAAGLLDALELERAHVLGISMGGMVAQELALRHPQRVRTLTLGCTYCGGPEGRLAGDEVATGLGQALLSGDRERALRAGYRFNLSQAFTADPANYEPFRTMATTLPVPVPVIVLQTQAIQGHDTSARLPRLEVPTLVIHGTEDRMLPFANGELIARLVPGARLERLEGVGHMFWWEQPERSARLVAEHALSARATARGAS